MENFEKFPNFYEEEIKLITYCPICNADLNPAKGRIIEDKKGFNLIHVQCNKCQGYILTLIMKTYSGISSVGLITDLNFNDVSHFRQAKALSADEVIKIHKIFNNTNILAKIIN